MARTDFDRANVYRQMFEHENAKVVKLLAALDALVYAVDTYHATEDARAAMDLDGVSDAQMEAIFAAVEDAAATLVARNEAARALIRAAKEGN